MFDNEVNHWKETKDAFVIELTPEGTIEEIKPMNSIYILKHKDTVVETYKDEYSALNSYKYENSHIRADLKIIRVEYTECEEVAIPASYKEREIA